MAQPGRVYDDEDAAHYTPDLLAEEGGTPRNEGGPLKSKKEKKAEDKKSAAAESAGALAGAEAAAAKSEKTPGQVGSGLQQEVNKLQGFRQRLQMTKGQKKGALIGGGVTGALIGVITLIFLLLIPLKIEHIVNDLQNRFFSSSHSAVKNMQQKLMDNFARHILKGRRACNNGPITKDCYPTIFGSGSPVKNLYHAWKDAKLEDSLATKYGIEFKYDSGSNTYYMKTPEMSDPIHQGVIKEATLNDPNLDLTKDFQQVDRATIRDTMKNSFQEETLWHRTMIRFKVGRLLEEKYGIRRCVVFCKVRDLKDQLAGDLKAQANAAKIYLIDRVITPRSDVLGTTLKCLLAASCKPQETTPKEDCQVGVNCEANGQAVSETDTAVSQDLVNAEAAQATEDVATLTVDATVADAVGGLDTLEVVEVGIPAMADATGVAVDTGSAGSGGAVSDFLAKALTAEAAAGALEKAIPIIGWIQLADQIVHFLEQLKNIGPKLKKLIYITNAAAAVNLWNLYRTYSDEIKSGHANATEVGSFVNSLGPGDQKGTLDCKRPDGKVCPGSPEIGGTSTAEATPAYQKFISDTQPITSNVSSFIPTAYAQTPAPAPKVDQTQFASTDYKCKNGKAVPTNKTVCSEETLGGCNSDSNAIAADACSVFEGIRWFLSLPGFDILFTASHIWRATIGKLFNLVGDALGLVLNPLFSFYADHCGPEVSVGGQTIVPGITNIIYPGFCQFLELKDKFLPVIVRALTNWLIPNPFGTNMSGGRTFDMMAAGSDVSGNDYAHHGLGGVELTPQQSADIINQEQRDAMNEFKRKPFFARMFDTTSDYSLVSKLAVSMPINPGVSFQNSFASVLSNPFGALFHNVANAFSATKVKAATAEVDPYGITQYGYMPQDIPNNPDQFWADHCNATNPLAKGTTTYNYNNKASQTPDINGMESNVPTNNPADFNGTDPCLLIQAAVGSSGGIYDQNLLTPDDLATLSTATAGTAANNKVYLIGDSLSVGLGGAGIANKLQATGWTLTQNESTVGINIGGSIPKLQADAANVQAAGTVIVELGTNHCSLSGTPSCQSATQFQGEATNMANAIKAINPSAQILWVTIYSAKSNVYTSINAGISQASNQLGFRTIDWAAEVTGNPGKYSFDSSLGVHLSGNGYDLMGQFISQKLGAPPVATANHPNAIMQALNNEQNHRPTGFANIWHKLGVLTQTFIQPFKHINRLWANLNLGYVIQP